MFRRIFLQTLILSMVLLPACSPVSPASLLFPTRTPTANATTSFTDKPTPTLTPTIPPASTTTPTRTPPGLPGLYQPSFLNPLDTPHTYIKDTCQYLHDKWSPAGSAPGTVVMAIMFHRITNSTLTDPNEISEYKFRRLMSLLHRDGFQAITTLQLAGFLEHNSKIPDRSVLLIADDKHSVDYFNGLFRQYWIDFGWPVVNAWISDNLTTSEIWKQQEGLNTEGWVDYQAHGVVSAPITSDSSDDYILGELQGPLTVFRDAFQQNAHRLYLAGGRLYSACRCSGAPNGLPTGVHDQSARTADVQLDSAGGCWRSGPLHLDTRRSHERSAHGSAALLGYRRQPPFGRSDPDRKGSCRLCPGQ